jgi:hypothetical protein
MIGRAGTVSTGVGVDDAAGRVVAWFKVVRGRIGLILVSHWVLPVRITRAAAVPGGVCCVAIGGAPYVLAGEGGGRDMFVCKVVASKFICVLPWPLATGFPNLIEHGRQVGQRVEVEWCW